MVDIIKIDINNILNKKKIILDFIPTYIITYNVAILNNQFIYDIIKFWFDKVIIEKYGLKRIKLQHASMTSNGGLLVCGFNDGLVCVWDLEMILEHSVKNRRNLWENYAGVIPDFGMFCEIMDKLTDDYTALYVHNATTSNQLEDCIYWYKARPVPQNFRIGCDEYWLYHEERYNKELDEKI